jgi:hypothetical protein
MNLQSRPIPEKAISALENGQKIKAIKITRAETGMHLKESKEAVELYIDSVPGLNEKFKSRNGLPLLLLVLAVVALAIYASGMLG